MAIDARATRIKMRWKANAAARETALASIVELPNGWWIARVGTPPREQAREFPTREAAVRAVKNHYSLLLIDALKFETRDRAQRRA